MTTTLASPPCAASAELQFTTFQVHDLLLGIDIRQVQEINRSLRLTPVPHAPEAVRGVINLRGEVVTVLDLRRVLRLPPAEMTRSTRNVIVNSNGEQIGLLVDQVTDVVTCKASEIDPLPENLGGVDQRFFQGVFKLDEGLLVILNVAETLSAVCGKLDS